MRKLLSLAFLFILGVAQASQEIPFTTIGPLGPTYATGSATSGTSSVISAAGAGVRNCVTDLDSISSTIANHVIFDGTLQTGTTIWGLLAIPAATRVNSDNAPEVAICGSPNTAMTIYVSSGTVAISYRGFQRGRP